MMMMMITKVFLQNNIEKGTSNTPTPLELNKFEFVDLSADSQQS